MSDVLNVIKGFLISSLIKTVCLYLKSMIRDRFMHGSFATQSAASFQFWQWNETKTNWTWQRQKPSNMAPTGLWHSWKLCTFFPRLFNANFRCIYELAGQIHWCWYITSNLSSLCNIALELQHLLSLKAQGLCNIGKHGTLSEGQFHTSREFHFVSSALLQFIYRFWP